MQVVETQRTTVGMPQHAIGHRQGQPLAILQRRQAHLPECIHHAPTARRLAVGADERLP